MDKHNDKVDFWRKRLKEYQKLYQKLLKQSPTRWWHDEFFENQLRVLETSISQTKTRILELKKRSSKSSN